jgi:phospholipase C
MGLKHRLSAALAAAAVLISGTMPIGIYAQSWEYVSPANRPQSSAAALTSAGIIKHIVVIFQKNVSFDHYFATYPRALNLAGESAFLARPATPSVNGLSADLIMFNPNSTKPFRLSREQAATCDQNHDYGTEQQAFDLGLMDKFPETVGVGGPGCPDYGKGKGLVMGYFDGSTTTALWNYAQNYAMSDNFFDTTFGPSTPGHLNLISGQTHGFTNDAGDPTATINNTVIGYPQPTGDVCDSRDNVKALTGKNVGDLLNAKGLTWGWFQGGFDLAITNPNGTTGCNRSHTSLVFSTPKVTTFPITSPSSTTHQPRIPNICGPARSRISARRRCEPSV